MQVEAASGSSDDDDPCPMTAGRHSRQRYSEINAIGRIPAEVAREAKLEHGNVVIPIFPISVDSRGHKLTLGREQVLQYEFFMAPDDSRVASHFRTAR